MVKRGAPVPWHEDPARVRPMLAMTTDRPPDDDLTNSSLVYEPKFDGIRALVAIEPAEPTPRVRLWSRLGNDKTSQFPEVIRGLKEFGRRLRAPVILDGEIVALDERGEPAGFQRLQGRMHLTGSRDIDRHARAQGAAFIAFDMLRDGAEDIRPLTLTDRRARLERLFGASGSEIVRHGDYVAGDGRRLYEQALAQGREGLVSKHAESIYESGRRSPAWRKLKLLEEEDFLIGGWTEPRDTRQYFGALLLGAYEAGKPDGSSGTRRLRYLGHAGTGFSGAELARVHRRLEERALATSPFFMKPPSNERPHWVRPDLVARVKFTGWTNEGVLRHPVYVGLRDDVDPSVVTVPESAETTRRAVVRVGGGAASRPRESVTVAARKRSPSATDGPRRELDDATLQPVLERLSELEAAKRDGTIRLPDGSSLDITNPAKVFWPSEKLTKGDLLRFYTRISPWLLPVVADRPLVMKRYPNGVKGKAFYQQRAPDEVPAGVRVEMTAEEDEPGGVLPRLAGGTLLTLLYVTQLAAISQDPWFSRISTPEIADYTALDLDPMPGVPFTQVREVARAVRDEIHALQIPAALKTSGSSGLHVYIPLPEGTPYEAGQLLARILATLVSLKHPKIATIERTVGKRGRTVYVDFLQNIQGKTLACAYSARASEFAGVSTPLAWDELDAPFDPHDFTMKTVFDRFARTGDLWNPVLEGPPVDVPAVLDRLASAS